MTFWTVDRIRLQLLGKVINYGSPVNSDKLHVIRISTINNHYVIDCEDLNKNIVKIKLTRQRMFDLMDLGRMFLPDAIFIGID
jgi:hypothetical protein